MAVSISTTHATMRTAASDDNAAVDRWSAAYSANDPETIAKTYCPDAILLRTVSRPLSGDKRTTFAQCEFFALTPNRSSMAERETAGLLTLPKPS